MSIKLECKIDWSGYNNVMKGLQELTEREIVIKYDDEVREGGMTNAELGKIHEDGVKNEDGSWRIPARPAMFRGSQILAEDITASSRLAVINAIKHKPAQVNKQLNIIGTLGIESVQSAIDRGNFTKLAPTTVRIKRNKGATFPTTALIDSGQLYESLMYKIK